MTDRLIVFQTDRETDRQTEREREGGGGGGEHVSSWFYSHKTERKCPCALYAAMTANLFYKQPKCLRGTDPL